MSLVRSRVPSTGLARGFAVLGCTIIGTVGADTIDVQDGSGGDTADGGLGFDDCTVDPGDTAILC